MPVYLYVLQIVANFLAVVMGPVSAILITLWYQRRREKRESKYRLFTVLMAHRKSNPPSFDLVQALNLIDVVFSDNREIVTLWHEYYDLISLRPVNWTLAESKYLDLIAKIASVLGHKNLLQTDISRFYRPEYYGNQFDLTEKTQKELLRVLENTGSFVVTKKDDDPPRNLLTK